MPSLPKPIEQRIENDVTNALDSITTINGRFIINDKIWYIKKAVKANPCVMNAADYISKKFGKNLLNLGWEQEKIFKPTTEEQIFLEVKTGDKTKNEGQRIDAFISLPLTEPGFYIPKNNFLDFLKTYFSDNLDSEIDRICSYFYQKYVKRNFFDIADIANKYQSFFFHL